MNGRSEKLNAESMKQLEHGVVARLGAGLPVLVEWHLPRLDATQNVASDGIARTKGTKNPGGPWRKISLMPVKSDDGAG